MMNQLPCRLAAALSLLLMGQSLGWGQEPRKTNWDLVGITGVHVLVEKLTVEVENAGVTTDQLTTDVELRLRQSGLKVFDDWEQSKKEGWPRVYVNVTALANEKFLTYSVHVALEQACELRRSPKFLVYATTWERSSLGRGYADNVRSAVRDRVDEFLNDYLKANPKN